MGIKNKIYTAILSGLMMLVATVGYGQFNDSTHYHVAFSPSGSINRTNDGRSYLINNRLIFNIKRQDVSLNFNNSWVFGKQNTTLTNNDYSSSLDFNLYKTFAHFFYWGLLNYNKSYSLKINNQLLTGVGVAYSIVENKNSYFNISDGLLYDQSDLILPDATGDIYHTYRNSLRLTFRFNIKEIIVIDGSNFLQNSLDRKYDYIIRSNTNLSIKLRQWLSLATSLNYARQSRTLSENLLFTYGINVEKYF
jgi:hypothetical protein